MRNLKFKTKLAVCSQLLPSLRKALCPAQILELFKKIKRATKNPPRSSSVFTTRVVNLGCQKKKVEILYHLKTVHYFFVGKHM